MKKLLFIIANIFIIVFGNAQSTDYSQITTNLLYTNPAFAGTKVCPRLITGYQGKFFSLGKVYQTYYATFDQYVDDLKGDIGLTFSNDIQFKGVIQNALAGLIYAKDVNLTSKVTLKLALQADFFQHTTNTNYLSYPDMIDPVYGFIYQSAEPGVSTHMQKANFSSGILAFSERQYFGIALFNINQPSSSNAKNNFLLQRKISVHYAYNFIVRPDNRTKKKELSILPNIQIFNQGKSTQIDYGVNFTKYFLMTGFSFKQNIGTNFDSFSLMIGFIQKKFKFAYNCDLSLTRSSGSLLDTHEASLTYYFNCVEKKKKNKAINCPGI